MEWNVSPEVIARYKRVVPKGKITVVELPPLKGSGLQPISARVLSGSSPSSLRFTSGLRISSTRRIRGRWASSAMYVGHALKG